MKEGRREQEKKANEDLNVTIKERKAMKEYLSFKHAEMNTIMDLTPERYKKIVAETNIKNVTPETLEQMLENIVQVYSLIYKEGNTNGTRVYRGMNEEESENISYTKKINYILSTSTDSQKAIRWDETGIDVYQVKVGKGLPYLPAEKYRDKLQQSEDEIVVLPFSAIAYWKKEEQTKDFEMVIEKQKLKEIAPEELMERKETILQQWDELKSNMAEEKELKDEIERMGYLISRVDPRDKELVTKDREKMIEKLGEVHKFIEGYQSKVTEYLQGTCKQKEKEIDFARSVIQEINRQKKQEKEEMLKKLNETKRENIVKEMQGSIQILASSIEKLQNKIEKIADVQEEFSINKIDTSEFQTTKGLESAKEKIEKIKEEIKESISEKSENSLKEQEDELIKYAMEWGKIKEKTNQFPSKIDDYETECIQDVQKKIYEKVKGLTTQAKTEVLEKEIKKMKQKNPTFIQQLFGANKIKEESIKQKKLQIDILNTTKGREDKISLAEIEQEIQKSINNSAYQNIHSELLELQQKIEKYFGNASKKSEPNKIEITEEQSLVPIREKQSIFGLKKEGRRMEEETKKLEDGKRQIAKENGKKEKEDFRSSKEENAELKLESSVHEIHKLINKFGKNEEELIQKDIVNGR